METLFTPNEAAAFVSLPSKRVYKELEYRVIQPVTNMPRLPFPALIYLRAFKEINFEFSVNYRSLLYQRLVEAWEQHAETLEIGKFFTLQMNEVTKELSDLISQFNEWKNHLVTDSNIMGVRQFFLIIGCLCAILEECLSEGNHWRSFEKIIPIYRRRISSLHHFM